MSLMTVVPKSTRTEADVYLIPDLLTIGGKDTSSRLNSIYTEIGPLKVEIHTEVPLDRGW